MVAELVSAEPHRGALTELLEREVLLDGSAPEGRVIFCGVSWERYLAFDRALGDDRPSPRLYYLEGELEIMTTSNEHEHIRKYIATLVEIYFEETDFEIMPRGQATMRTQLKEAGAEPDESWCLGQEKQWPDLVLEIALTSGGVNKLEIYRRFAVPEVWFWRRSRLEIFVLRGEGYERSAASALLPKLDLDLLQRCVAIPSWREARRTFRAGLA